MVYDSAGMVEISKGGTLFKVLPHRSFLTSLTHREDFSSFAWVLPRPKWCSIVDDAVTDGVGQSRVIQILVSPFTGAVLGTKDGRGHADGATTKALPLGLQGQENGGSVVFRHLLVGVIQHCFC